MNCRRFTSSRKPGIAATRLYLKQSWPQVGTFKRPIARRYGLLANQDHDLAIDTSDIYKNLGLTPEALEMAKNNPHRARIRREMSAELVEFLTQIDIIDTKATPKWRDAGLMA